MKVFQALQNYLDREDFKYQIRNENSLRTGFSGQNGQYQGNIIVVEDKFVLFYFGVLYNVEEGKRAAVCEFITRANYGLNIGNFEMDIRDGELRYKTSLPLHEGYVPSDKTFERLLYVNMSTIDRYAQALNKVVFGNTSAADAIESVEGKS